MTDSRITLDSSKRGGRPCIRNLRISVYDVLEMLPEGISEADIIEDFPELESADIRACLAFAADREHIARPKGSSKARHSGEGRNPVSQAQLA